MSTAELDADGEAAIVVTLSAVQMAAVLEGDTVQTGGTVGNRVIGGLRTLGCAAEAGLAGALAVAPEPTMLTKVGAVGLAAHAADQCATGARQIWTGRDARSLAEQGTTALASSLGASPRTASNIGMAADFAVPLGGAAIAGAIRVSAVQNGRISLYAHEARAGSKIGGHTIQLHVGKSEAFLRQRLAETAGLRYSPAAISSFTSLRGAETVISQALRANRQSIAQWSTANGPNIRFPFVFNAQAVVGHGVVRTTGQYVPMTKIRVVLKKGNYNGMTHYIVTAFPVL